MLNSSSILAPVSRAQRMPSLSRGEVSSAVSRATSSWSVKALFSALLGCPVVAPLGAAFPLASDIPRHGLSPCTWPCSSSHLQNEDREEMARLAVLGWMDGRMRVCRLQSATTRLVTLSTVPASLASYC